MIIILLGLIFVGSLRESSVEQLIEGAGPDSSGYQQPLTESPVETPPPPVEVKKENLVPTPSAENESTENAVSQQDKIETATPKVQESNGEKIYYYMVKRGDTMYKIAAKFGNKPDDILTLNGMTDMGLKADAEIKVKIKALHSVVSGEGLNAIAEKYQVPPKSILAANGLNSENLSEGIELIIPLK